MGTINQVGNPSSILERTMGLPGEGPKMIPLRLDFTATPSYLLDYQNMQARGYLAMVQSLFADNSNSTVSLTIVVANAQQTLIVPPGAQAYLPILVPNPPRITFTCNGGPANTVVILLNFPVQPEVWLTSTGVVTPAVSATALTGQFSQVSTDAVVDVTGSTVDKASVGSVNMSYNVFNSGANSINLNVIVWDRLDQADANQLVSTTLTSATGARISQAQTRFSKLQIQSATAGLPGTLTGGFYGAAGS